MRSFKDHFGENMPAVGAEVGVHLGSLSAYLLDTIPGLTLIMVDPWKEWEVDERYRVAGHKLVEEDQEQNYQATLQRVGPWIERTQIMRELSLEAVTKMEDGSLDFVFIDADHSYEGCKEDIAAWWPKVRSGGLLMGHDYGSPKWGVMDAVNEWVQANGLPLQVYPGSVWTSLKV